MNNKAKKAICRKEDLGNEASVEQFFVDRLLKRLGWADSQIKTKESISVLSVNLGQKRCLINPTTLFSYRRKVRFVIDAKSTKGKPRFLGRTMLQLLSSNQPGL